MLTSKAKSAANAATTFGLATTVAALWMAAVPIAGAAPAGYPISAARATALQAGAARPTSGVMHIGTVWSNMASRSNLKRVNEPSRLFVGAITSPWRRGLPRRHVARFDLGATCR